MDVMKDFKCPNLSRFTATGREKQLAEKYTRIRCVACDGLPHAHTSWLYVNGQHFNVTPLAHDDDYEASWQCWMLAKALAAVIDEQRQEPSQ